MAKYVNEANLQRFWDNIQDRIGSVSQEQVDAWLDEHPEATTTVQDGSITTAKLADGAVTDAKLVQTGGVLESVDKVRSYQYDLLSNLLLGYYYQRESATVDYIGTYPNNGVQAVASKVSRGDVIEYASDGTYRAAFNFFDAEYSYITTNWNDWNASGQTSARIYISADGYVLTRIKSSNGSTLSDASAIAAAMSAVVKSDKDYSGYDTIDSIVMGSAIVGNNSAVSIESDTTYARTNFIKVQEGDTLHFDGTINGLNSRSNIHGIAGFASNNVSTFKKWLFSPENAGTTADVLAHYNATITVPAGINYVMVSFCRNRVANCLTGLTVKALQKGTVNDRVSYAIERSGIGKSARLTFCTANSTGDCTLVKFDSGETLMVDTGAAFTPSREAIMQALNDSESTHVDHLVISHYHSDHVGNVPYLIENGYIDASTVVYLPQTPDLEVLQSVASATYDNYTATINALNSEGCTLVYPTERQKVSIASATLEFLNTDHSAYYENLTDYNLCSLCFYFTIGNQVVLFTGDAYSQALSKVAENGRKCNIYKNNHHGMGGQLVSWEPMEYFWPEIVVTMMGRVDFWDTTLHANFLQWFNAGQNTQAWCEARNVPNYITGVNEHNIVITMNENSWRFLSNSKAYIVSE